MSIKILKRIFLVSAMVLCTHPLSAMENMNPFPDFGKVNINRPQVYAQQQQPQFPMTVAPHHNTLPWMNQVPQNQVTQHPPQYVMTLTGDSVICQTTYQAIYPLPPLQHNPILIPQNQQPFIPLAAFPGNHVVAQGSMNVMPQQQIPLDPLQPGFSQGLGGMKRPHSPLIPEIPLYPISCNPAPQGTFMDEHPFFTKDIFHVISRHLNFKDYIVGFASVCSILRHWAIGQITNFSEEKEEFFPESDKWNHIPENYRKFILYTHHLSAFTSLISLDLSGSKNDSIQGDDLPCFTNLQALNLCNNDIIKSGSWAYSLTNLTSLRINLEPEPKEDDPNILPCMGPILEHLPNLKILDITCLAPLNYENIFGLKNITHLIITNQYFDNYISEDISSINIVKRALWEKLPNLEVYDYYPYYGDGVRQTRESFSKEEEDTKNFITSFKHSNPNYSFLGLDNAVQEFRKTYFEKLPRGRDR